MKEYEVLGGVLETPEKGSVKLPPEQSGRKDIEEGLIVIKTTETPKNLAKAVAMAKQNGITEIPTARKDKDDGIEI